MTDRELRAELRRLVRRASLTLMLNRLLTFLLVNAVLYVLLLLLVVAADLPLLSLNLACFTSLALFPGWLLLPLPPGRLKLFIRRVDRHCLLESYLETRAEELRRYMLPDLRRLLSRMSGQSIAPLRPSRLNCRLAAALLACLLCHQVGLFLRFDSFTWSLSARELQAMTLSLEPGGGSDQARQEAAEGRESPEDELLLPREGEPAVSRPEAASPLDLTALPEGGTEAPRGARRAEGVEEPAPGGAENAGEGQRRLSENAGRDVSGDAGGGLESGEGEQGERGRGTQQAGSAGRVFLPSPLEEYRAALRELAARGGSELTAGSPAEALQPGAWPSALFRDYRGSRLPLSVLDPLLARIRADYLRLIYERF